MLGERPDETIAHISEVASGRGCGCICPGCGAALIARKGRVNDHHFAHEGSADGSPCRTGPETALHKLAKEVLERELRLTLPQLVLEEDGERWIRYRGGVHAFDAAVLEQRLGEIVPDVIVRRGDRDLLVEFAVTHACGPEKIARIRDLDLAAIEIDLSELPRDTSRPDLEAAILDAAPRIWIHNPLLAEGRAELQRRRRAREAAARRRAVDVAAAYARACVELGAVRPSTPELETLTQEGFGGALGTAVRGYGCFRVPPGDWQAALLAGIFEAHRLQGTITFRVDRALGRLRRVGWLRPEFARLTDAEVAAAKAEGDRFGSPADAVEAWASNLVLVGILMPWTGGWQLRGTAIVRADAARRRRLRPIERSKHLEALFGRILSAIPEEEAAGLTFERWIDASLPGRDHTIRQALQFEDADYNLLAAPIAQLAAGISHDARVPDDRFGLPQDGVAARGAERRRLEAEERRRATAARAQQAAARRVEGLLAEGRSILGLQADAWLHARNAALQGRTPAEAAGADDAGLGAAVAAAEDLARRQVLQGRADIEADEARGMIRVEARRTLRNDEQLEVYLRCPHPALEGKSPLEFCTTPGMVRRCLEATLPTKKTRRS